MAFAEAGGWADFLAAYFPTGYEDRLARLNQLSTLSAAELGISEQWFRFERERLRSYVYAETVDAVYSVEAQKIRAFQQQEFEGELANELNEELRDGLGDDYRLLR